MILLRSPNGPPVTCCVCGDVLTIPHGCTRFPDPSRPRAAEDRADAPSDVVPEPGAEGGVSSTKHVYGDPAWGALIHPRSE